MKEEKIGSTNYPRLDADDLRIGVAHDDDGNLHVTFGTEVHWVAMRAEAATDSAEMILDHAREAKAKE